MTSRPLFLVECPIWNTITEGIIDSRVCLVPGPLVRLRRIDYLDDFAARYSEGKDNLQIARPVLTRDFDGDGIVDLLVNGFGSAERLEGRITFISDPPLVDADYDDVTTATISGADYEALGVMATASPGDLDADGYEDIALAVGLPYELPTPIGFAAFYGLIVGPAMHSECADVWYTSSVDFEIPRDTFHGGDFDGDGFADLVLGGYGEAFLFYGPFGSGTFSIEWHTNVDNQDGSVFVFFGGQGL